MEQQLSDPLPPLPSETLNMPYRRQQRLGIGDSQQQKQNQNRPAKSSASYAPGLGQVDDTVSFRVSPRPPRVPSAVQKMQQKRRGSSSSSSRSHTRGGDDEHRPGQKLLAAEAEIAAAERMRERRRSVSAAAMAAMNEGSRSSPRTSRGRKQQSRWQQQQQQETSLTAATTEERSVAVEVRDFARAQLSSFRSGEAARQEASRRLRTGLRNIETLLSDVPITRELAEDVRERMPSEMEIHQKLTITSLHQKVLELTELLEACLKSETGLRRRLESAEARAASAEDKVIDLQAELFEANLKAAHVPGSGTRRF